MNTQKPALVRKQLNGKPEESRGSEFDRREELYRAESYKFTVGHLLRVRDIEKPNQSLVALGDSFMELLRSADSCLGTAEASWKEFTQYISNPGHTVQTIRKIPLYIKGGYISTNNKNAAKQRLRHCSLQELTQYEGAPQLYSILKKAFAVVKFAGQLKAPNIKTMNRAGPARVSEYETQVNVPGYARGAGLFIPGTPLSLCSNTEPDPRSVLQVTPSFRVPAAVRNPTNRTGSPEYNAKPLKKHSIPRLQLEKTQSSARYSHKPAKRTMKVEITDSTHNSTHEISKAARLATIEKAKLHTLFLKYQKVL